MENCKGCLTKSSGIECSYIGYKGKKGTVRCPCRICLIKMVCQNICELYEDFSEGYRTFVISIIRE